MPITTQIEWTDATWNPATGCTKVTRGCDFCYAERLSERFRGVPEHPFQQGFDLTLRPDRVKQPLTWRQPRRIFVNSMSDLFHKEIPKDFVDAVFDTFLFPLLGLIFLPFTTLIWLFLDTPPFGVTGFDWFWVGLAVLLDLSHYGSTYGQRDRFSRGAGTGPPPTTATPPMNR